jgi:hypothetical protein
MLSNSKASRAQGGAREESDAGPKPLARSSSSAAVKGAATEPRSKRDQPPAPEAPLLGHATESPSGSSARDPEIAPAEGTAREGDVRWRQLLAGGTPREILCRIVQGDPLEMRDRVARRLHDESYLLDADRVQLRSLARCARFASRYSGRPDFATWLDAIVDAAIDDLLREDLEVELDREKSTSTPGAAFVALAQPLGLEPGAMRRACASFNQLPAPDRRAFFELVIQGRALDELARQGRESASEIARRARRALDLVLQASAPEARPPETKPGGHGSSTPESCGRPAPKLESRGVQAPGLETSRPVPPRPSSSGPTTPRPGSSGPANEVRP